MHISVKTQLQEILVALVVVLLVKNERTSRIIINFTTMASLKANDFEGISTYWE